MNKNEHEFVTDVAMGWVTYSYGWRMALAIALLSFIDFWFVYPSLSTLAIVLEIVGVLVILMDGIRRILRCRAKLRFVGESLSVNDYCGSSFRLDDLKHSDFIIVQNPGERWVNTGRLLIRKKGIYLRGVRNVKQMSAYIDRTFAVSK